MKENPGIDYSVKPPNILRTVYMENNDIKGLKAELETELMEIGQDKATFENEIHSLRMERSKIDGYAREEFLAD